MVLFIRNSTGVFHVLKGHVNRAILGLLGKNVILSETESGEISTTQQPQTANITQKSLHGLPWNPTENVWKNLNL